MSEERVTIQQKLSHCRAWVLTPDGTGRWPAAAAPLRASGLLGPVTLWQVEAKR